MMTTTKSPTDDEIIEELNALNNLLSAEKSDLQDKVDSMLSALEKLMQVIGRSYGIVAYYDDGGIQEWSGMEEVEIIKAAIAKAKGE
jgi:hypothetical protein